MAEKITFNTGAKSYEIVDQDGNELGVFRFIPTDVGILNRYKETAAFLSMMIEPSAAILSTSRLFEVRVPVSNYQYRVINWGYPVSRTAHIFLFCFVFFRVFSSIFFNSFLLLLFAFS